MVANDAKVFTKYEFHGKQCRYFALVFGGALLGTFPGSRMPKHGHGRSGNAPGRPLGLLAKVYDPLRAFARKDEEHPMMRSEAVALLRIEAQLRRLMIAPTGTTILPPLRYVMIFWITSIFVSWDLFSRADTISVTTFFVAALRVSGAIFLILELYTPCNGMLRLPSAPLPIAYDSLRR